VLEAEMHARFRFAAWGRKIENQKYSLKNEKIRNILQHSSSAFVRGRLTTVQRLRQKTFDVYFDVCFEIASNLVAETPDGLSRSQANLLTGFQT
jgi:hypothetical protein